jgi:hypothetical protein
MFVEEMRTMVFLTLLTVPEVKAMSYIPILLYSAWHNGVCMIGI